MYSRFQHLAELKGVTPYRVGKETGVNTATFTTWKSGKHTPTIETLKKIADYFNVPVTYFLEEDENIDNQLLEVAVSHLSSNLRADQRQIIKRAASLDPEEVIVVDMIIKALKEEPRLKPEEVTALKMFIKALKGGYDE